MQTAITTYQPTLPPLAQASTEEQASWTLKEKILYSLFGVVVVGGVVFVARKIVLKRIADKEENRSFEDGSSATVAKQLKMAFENDGWPGTNTTMLRGLLREVGSKEEFSKIAKSYEKLYSTPSAKANLMRDMSGELQSTEYNEMLQILAGKPDKKGQALPSGVYSAWAKRLKAAFDKSYGIFGGTDGEAIIAVFSEIPTQSAYIQTTTAYYTLYKKLFTDELKGESEFGQYEEWMKIITAKPR